MTFEFGLFMMLSSSVICILGLLLILKIYEHLQEKERLKLKDKKNRNLIHPYGDDTV